MHTVIVGGGFGGIKTAIELGKRQLGKVTLISDKPYFLHHATLYATATGKSTEESVVPLNTLLARYHNVEVIEDSVTHVEPHRHLIRSDKCTYHYDKLVLALGSVTSFRNIKGVEQHAYGIKTLEEIREFQDHIHEAVVEKKLDKHYFVIGGSLSGVEMASSLNEYLASLVSVYRLKNTHPKVTLVEAAPRIVPLMSKTASKKISHALKKQGVTVLCNKKVTSLGSESIKIDNKTYPTETAIWTSGVANNPFFAANKDSFELTQNGRVVVNPYLEANEDIYVIGDSNNVRYSGMALPAIHQATCTAKNITRIASGRHPRRFKPHSVPVGVPVGSRWGYVEWHGIYQAGRLGHTFRRWMELNGYCKLMPYKEALPIWRSHDISDVDDLF